MSDYIKREDAENAFRVNGLGGTCKDGTIYITTEGLQNVNMRNSALALLRRIPSADVVEVVRKPVKGYEGHYEVDQFGRVYSLGRTVHVIDNGREYDKPIAGKQLKQSMHTQGYKTVGLTLNGETKTLFVHRIVAEAFIENPNNLPMVNHKDEDKTNNFVENLEWCTNEYNISYGHAKEKRAKKLRGRPHTEEHKRKISEGVKAHYCSEGKRRTDEHK